MSNRQADVEDDRFQELTHWFYSQNTRIAGKLGLSQLPQGQFSDASSDASFRRYFRWQTATHSLVLMDAPPPRENCLPFVTVARLLSEAGLHVPQVLAQDLRQGFLVLSDLGNETWLHCLNAENADAWFNLALDMLIKLQRIEPQPWALPDYDEMLLRRELELFPQWYVMHELGVQFSARQQQDWQQSCTLLINSALRQNRVLVHRDYMPRNLMVSEPNPGLLDFQDAVIGPVSYDVISLFKDAFISWPPEKITTWLMQYWHMARAQGLALPDDWRQFLRDCDWMGVQRHLKVIGIFSRIYHRDGKQRYLADVPRFLNYIREVLQRYPELQPLARLLESLPIPEYGRAL